MPLQELCRFGEQLEAYDIGDKGTLRVPYDKPVPVRLITAMATQRAKENAEASAAKAASKPTTRKPVAKKLAAKKVIAKPAT